MNSGDCGGVLFELNWVMRGAVDLAHDPLWGHCRTHLGVCIYYVYYAHLRCRALDNQYLWRAKIDPSVPLVRGVIAFGAIGLATKLARIPVSKAHLSPHSQLP